MRWMAVLSKKHSKLPFEELVSVVKSESEDFNIVERFGERGVLFESDNIDFSRLGFTLEVSRIFSGPFKKVEDLEVSPSVKGSFCVRAISFGLDSQEYNDIERKAGSYIDSEFRDVDLEDPVHFIRVFDTEKGFYIGERVFKRDGGSFEDRRSHLRPFSSPVSLHPVLARCMVNLSGANAGEGLFDPFCGTGGILLEAGLIGLGVCGCDISPKMVEGCRENLDFYGVESYNIFEQDAYRLLEEYQELGKSFDCIVTDLPYGKSSLKFQDKKVMVERLLKYSTKVCDGKLVFMMDEKEVAGLEHDFEIYVHSSLSRYLYVVDPKQLNFKEEL